MHRALLSALGEGEEAPRARRGRARPPCTAPSASASRARIERDADDVCAAFLLERELFERAGRGEFEGEVSGVIGAGAFVAFGGELGDVYEGFLPARRLRGERFELNRDRDRAGRRADRPRGCASATRSTVRVERRRGARGRVDLEPAEG